MNWWKANKYEFPSIAQAIRDYLAIPVLEVNVKRLFNIRRDILGVRRFAMAGETLKICIMLKDFLRCQEEGQI